jgi:two-component system, response regulator PdtaR
MMATMGSGFSIVIADDDAPCREALRDIVQPAGYHTLLASSGEEALDIVRHEPRIHLVLLDMHMPRMTGLETSQLLHQLDAMLPTVLVTADATEQLMRQAIQAHVYSVIPKPVSKNVVLYTVVRALARFSERKQDDSTDK